MLRGTCMIITITNTMEIIKTQKRGEVLIWQGSKFTLNCTMASGKKYWRCCKRTCPARVTSERDEVLQQTNGHNHPVDGVEAQVERVKHKLRKRARKEVTPIPSIYNDALVDIAANAEETESLAGRLPTFLSLKSSMHCSHRSRMPSLPQSREDVTLEGR